MTLITKQGFAADGWTRIEADAPAPTGPSADRVVWPLARLEDAFASGAKLIGVQIPNTTRIAELAPYLDRLALVSIAFPSFSDGRGFSVAKGLRHAGFTGELRAFGPLIADQFAHAQACGFDAVEVPEGLAERQPEGHWKAAAASLSLAYQRGYDRGLNILDQRRKAAQSRSQLDPAQAGLAWTRRTGTV